MLNISTSEGPDTRCNFSSNLQRNSTLGRCKIGKYKFPSQVANIFWTHQTFLTNLHLLRAELHCKLQEKLGWCDIEKNRYIDIDKKISIISTISNYANWIGKRIIYSTCTMYRITNKKTKLPETSQTLKDLLTTVYECLKIYLIIQA